METQFILFERSRDPLWSQSRPTKLYYKKITFLQTVSKMPSFSRMVKCHYTVQSQTKKSLIIQLFNALVQSYHLFQ